MSRKILEKYDIDSNYHITLLSDLLKKSRQKPYLDFQAAVHYIFARLDTLNETMPDSQFNRLYRKIRKLVPKVLLIRLFYHLRYDAMIGFCEREQSREIYGMITFQKHPQKGKIGMFDIYISPEHRGKDLLGNFSIMANLVYRLCERFRQGHYRYIQCGENATTRRVLRLYKRLGRKNEWSIDVDVEKTRIYLQTPPKLEKIG